MIEITVVKKTKIYNFLTKLTPQEWEGFGAYLGDPSLGASELYGYYLQAFLGIHEGRVVDSHEAFLVEVARVAQAGPKTSKRSKVAHKLTWDARHMNRHLSQMLSKLFDFLGYQHFLADASLWQLSRMRALGARGWQAAMVQEFEDAQTSLAQATWSAGAEHLHVALLAQTPQFLEVSRLLSNGADPLQAAIDRLDRAYTITALELAARARNTDQFEHTLHTDPQWLTQDLGFAAQMAQHETNSAVQLELYRMYQFGAEPATHFDQALDLLKGAKLLVTKGDSVALERILDHLISHAGRHLQSDRVKYGAAILQLYGYLLDRQVGQDQGQLSPIHYHNMAHRAMKIAADDQAPAFLALHKTKLAPHLQEPIHALCLVQWYFYRGMLGDAAAQMESIQGRSDAWGYFELTLSCRTFEVVLPIASGLYEEGERMARNFLAWLQRHRGSLSPDRYAGYRMFGRSAAKLAKWGAIRDGVGPAQNWKLKIGQLEEAWKRQPPVHRTWLGALLDGFKK